MLSERGTDGHREVAQEIPVGPRKVSTHVLSWQLGTRCRHEKNLSANTNMMLVREIARATSLIRILRIMIEWRRTVIVMAMPMSVMPMRMSVLISVNTRLTGIGRMVVTARV